MDTNHFSTIRDTQLRQEMKRLLYEQQNKVTQIAFLAPDVDHVFRVHANACRLLANTTLRTRLEETFGQTTQQVVLFAAFLSKIGFAHPDLDPRDSSTFSHNRTFALELLLPLKACLQQELAFQETEYKRFIEALLREGTFGVGTRDDFDNFRGELAAHPRLTQVLRAHGFTASSSDMSVIKYANPLTSLLTLASEMDISQLRLQDWQRNETIMKILIEISADPALATLEIEKFALDAALARLQTVLDEANRAGHRTAEIEMQTGQLAHLQQEVLENRRRCKQELDHLVRREFVSQEARIKAQLMRGGLSEHAADAMYSRVRSCIIGITGESYLWYVASNSVASVDVGNDGHAIVLVQTDHTDSFGAVASLSHIRNFHVDRLANLIRQVNVALAVDLRLERSEHKRQQDLWNHCQGLFKGDIHMHLKMSIMANRVWESLIGPQLDVYEAVFEESQRLFNKLRHKRNLPQNVDLKRTFAEANRKANTLFNFIVQYRHDYRWPDDKDALPLEARATANKYSHQLSSTELELLDEDIRLYYTLKFHVTKLFSFTDGALPDFVEHFTAVSKLLSKVSPTDEASTLKTLTHAMLIDACHNGVWYVEPRFNIGSTGEETLHQVLLVLQAYKELQEANPGQPLPIMKIILSITKFVDDDRSFEEHKRLKTTQAESFVTVLRDAQRRFLDANRPYEVSGRKYVVTPQDVLLHVGGIDTAGQEEFNPPELFFDAFRLVVQYNHELKAFHQQVAAGRRGSDSFQVEPIGMTYHVAESIADVSVESGIRHLFEAIYMKPFPEVDDQDIPLLNRVGHAIVIALSDYDQFWGKSLQEDVLERIRQIEFDLTLCRMGIPLLAVSAEALQAELQELTRYTTVRWDLASGGPPEGAATLGALAERWGIDTAGQVAYIYDREAALIDLETRAGLARDYLIRHNIVVETCPTSNLGVSPFIHTYVEHTLRTYLTYDYGAWSRSARLITALEARAGGGDRAEASRAREQIRMLKEYQRESLEYHGKKVRVTVNTDDGTLFGVSLVDEYYRTALALNVPRTMLSRLAEVSLEAAIQPLPQAGVNTLRQRVATGRLHLQLPTRGVGGLNEFIIEKLKACAEEIELTHSHPPILKEGEPEDGYFYLILDGSLKVEIGGQQVVTRHKNELFGELASITGKRTATVVAGENGARLLRMRKTEFLKLCEQDVTIRQYFENVIASRDTSGLFRGFAAHFTAKHTVAG